MRAVHLQVVYQTVEEAELTVWVCTLLFLDSGLRRHRLTHRLHPHHTPLGHRMIHRRTPWEVAVGEAKAAVEGIRTLR
jgi:hypothetical protein